MAGEVVHRLVVAEGEVAKLKRRKVMRAAEFGVVPGPDGTRVVYTTADVGELVTDVATALAGDFAAMPDDPRHKGLSAGWRRRADCIEAFSAAPTGTPPRRVEFLGILRSGIDHTRQLAREMRVYEEEAGIDGSAFIFRQPDDPLEWRRFKRWAGLEEPGRKRRPRGRRLRLEAA
jgi:hypothetical protein